MKKYFLHQLFSPREYHAPQISLKVNEYIFSRTTRRKISFMKKMRYFVPVGVALVIGFFVFSNLEYLNIDKKVIVVPLVGIQKDPNINNIVNQKTVDKKDDNIIVQEKKKSESTKSEQNGTLFSNKNDKILSTIVDTSMNGANHIPTVVIKPIGNSSLGVETKSQSNSSTVLSVENLVDGPIANKKVIVETDISDEFLSNVLALFSLGENEENKVVPVVESSEELIYPIDQKVVELNFQEGKIAYEQVVNEQQGLSKDLIIEKIATEDSHSKRFLQNQESVLNSNEKMGISTSSIVVEESKKLPDFIIEYASLTRDANGKYYFSTQILNQGGAYQGKSVFLVCTAENGSSVIKETNNFFVFNTLDQGEHYVASLHFNGDEDWFNEDFVGQKIFCTVNNNRAVLESNVSNNTKQLPFTFFFINIE